MDLGTVLLAVLAFIGAVMAAFWLTLIIWTFRDMRARSRDVFAQILAALLVAIMFLPGLVIYMLLRPRETLAEGYERSLEEEALLQGIEETLVCPGCAARVQAEFVVCPACHTKLKKACQNCGRALNMRWSICPYCSTPALGGMPVQAAQPTQATPAISGGFLRRAQRVSEPAAEIPPPPPAEQAEQAEA
jgi:RNA polymerase subunit RPABC4/transcription elongation factor Spt4